MGGKIGELMQEGISLWESVTGELAARYKDLQTLPLRNLLFQPHSDEQPGTEYCKALNRISIIPSDVGVRGRQYLLAV